MSFQGFRNQPGPLWKPAIFTSTLNDLWICFGAEDNSENPEKYLAKILVGGEVGCILKCSLSINHILIFLIEEDQIFKSNHMLWKINLNLSHSSIFHLNLPLYSSSVFFSLDLDYVVQCPFSQQSQHLQWLY